MKIIIIGNGVAANSAALAIREHERESDITMLSDENEFFYARPRLTEYLAGKSPFEKIIIHDEKWYEKNNIDLLRGARVSSIDTEHRIVCGSFEDLPYDKLLIASGASPSFPPFYNPQLEKVFVLRTKEQADRIIAASQQCRSAAIIGGGLLGIETAYALSERGLESTIVEYYKWLLPRQLDEDSASILQELLLQKGIKFLLGKQTSSLSNENGKISISFSDGGSVYVDMTIISAGVRPNIAFLRDSKISIGRGITIDNQMRTNLPDVYAAGDCAEFSGKMYGIWPAAKEQGEMAGHAIAGQSVDYRGSVMSTKLKVLDLAFDNRGGFT